MQSMKLITVILTIWVSLGTFAQIDTTGTASFEKKKGSLIIPVNNFISVESCCLEQYKKKHLFLGSPIINTIKIICDSNSRAIAVAEGRVIGVINISDSYTVLVRHGNYATVYSNLVNVTVKKGDAIEEKRELGTIKTSNSRTILNFELWFVTRKIDPVDWFVIH